MQLLRELAHSSDLQLPVLLWPQRQKIPQRLIVDLQEVGCELVLAGERVGGEWAQPSKLGVRFLILLAGGGGEDLDARDRRKSDGHKPPHTHTYTHACPPHLPPLGLHLTGGGEDLSHGPRNHACRLWTQVAAALHRVRLAAARLPVGENADVIPVQGRLEEEEEESAQEGECQAKSWGRPPHPPVTPPPT